MKRKRKRKLTRTTPMKKSLLTNLSKNMALVELQVLTLHTFPSCLPTRHCHHCLWLFTSSSSSHTLDILKRLHLKQLSLPLSMATTWNRLCALHSSALSALFVCTLLPTRRTSNATSYCTGQSGGSSPVSCAPSSSTGLMTSSGIFGVCINSMWTQRDGSKLRPAWLCDTRFELRAEQQSCRPVWCATRGMCLCARLHFLTAGGEGNVCCL